MQYSGETNGQDIVTTCDDFVDSSSTSYPIEKKTRRANRALRTIMTWIFRIYGGWILEDTNLTTLPSAKTQLTQGRQFYPLPTRANQLYGVSIADPQGNWTKLIPITLEEIQERGYDEEDFMDTNGTPEFYRPVANGFKVYPASDVTIAESLKSFFTGDIVAFSVDDTTAEPGFDPLFHEAIAVFMAMEYADDNEMSKAKGLRRKWSNESDADYPEGYEQKIKRHYRTLFRQQFPIQMRTGDIISDYN